MLEVIVSLYILSLTVVTAATLIINSLQVNRINRERMIATYLVSEGRNAIQNIFDSNRLRYSATEKECWNFWENPEEAAARLDMNFITCDPSGPAIFPDKMYFVYHYGRYDLDSEFGSDGIPYTYKSFLVKPAKQEDIENLDPNDPDFAAFDEYKLQYRDLLPSVDGKDGDGNFLNDRDQALYVANDGPNVFETPPRTYYRQIYFEYHDIDTDGQNDLLNTISKVVWFEKGRKHLVQEVLTIEAP